MSHRKTAIGAVVAATLAASTVAVTTQPGAAAPEEHITRAVLQLMGEKSFGSGTGPNIYVSTNALRRDGRVVGYESVAGRGFDPEQGRIVLRLAIALKGGVIMGRVVGLSDQTGDRFFYRGPIESGNGRFSGITGRIVEVESPSGPTRLILRWHIAE